MSLHDVDIITADRSSPKPSFGDALPEAARMSHNTSATTYVPTGATAFRQRVVFKNNMLLYYDDQNRVIKVDGFISSLAPYPVTIQAVYGFDVFTDILGIPGPGSI